MGFAAVASLRLLSPGAVKVTFLVIALKSADLFSSPPTRAVEMGCKNLGFKVFFTLKT